MNSFKIKNKYLVGLASWLNEVSLQGSESRERTRFINVLVERITENEKFRMELLDKHVTKDDSNQMKKKTNEITNEEVWDISDENMILFTKEYGDLMEEEYVMDILDGNKQKLKVMKNVVLNTNYIFGPKEGDLIQEKTAKIRQMHDYEIWCQSFEGVDFSD